MQIPAAVNRWINGPLMIRLMRYRLYNNIDTKLDLTPHYPQNKKDLKVGVVLGTFGSVPFIDLQLHYLKNINGIEKILIHDDCSDKQEELKKLCSDYNVDFISSKEKLFYFPALGSIGDQNCFYEGLKWAKENNLDIVIKISRRLLPCYRWIDDFIDLVYNTDGITFSSYCEKDNFPIRTELIGMNVNAWANQVVLDTLKWYIDNSFPVFTEFWTDELAKMIDYQNYSEKYYQYVLNNKFGYLHSGYVHWYDILGNNRYNKNSRKDETILWHQYSKIEDYLEVSKQIFGEKYKLEDFK